MKILYIHNEYVGFTGEEHASHAIAQLLNDRGHVVEWYKRSSIEINNSFFKKNKAFFAGIYNPFTPRGIRRKLVQFQPDIAIVQNIYPLISPSVFRELKAYKIPVVMRCPNYRLFCPNGLFLDTTGNVCEKCLSKGREYWAFRNNCLNSRFKSLGYALRGGFSRKSKMIINNVDVFVVQTEFQKQKFIDYGIPEEKISIVPGLTPEVDFPERLEQGKFVTFVGRVSHEKGINNFIDAARMLPGIQFAIAGKCSDENLKNNSPQNVKWMGFLEGEKLNQIYLGSRIIVVPSKWYEGFPNVITRAMQMKKPVIAANIGAMMSIIEDGKTGLLFEPGNSVQLAERVNELYNDTDKCRAMGEAGYKKATQKYSSDAVYKSLIAAFDKAKQLHKRLQ